MRQLLVTFLIMSLLGGQLGMVGTLLMGHRYDQERMLRRIEEASTSPDNASALEYLVIPRAELSQPGSSFTRIEEHEFFYRGKLYDIVHEEQRGPDWHVWALHDREEERYLEALARTVEYFRVPRDTLVLCVGKSTYARCGIIVNVTPLEPEWRGSGRAAEMLDEITSIAGERGILQIELNVHAGNARAIGFYQAHGFITFGRLPRAFRAGDRFADDLLMVRMLDA